MSNPNSILTRVRYRLAQWLEPYPDSGEGWCVGCELNGGKTLIVSAAGHVDHVRQHQDEHGTTHVAMRVNWGHIPHEPDEED